MYKEQGEVETECETEHTGENVRSFLLYDLSSPALPSPGSRSRYGQPLSQGPVGARFTGVLTCVTLCL